MFCRVKALGIEAWSLGHFCGRISPYLVISPVVWMGWALGAWWFVVVDVGAAGAGVQKQRLQMRASLAAACGDVEPLLRGGAAPSPDLEERNLCNTATLK